MAPARRRSVPLAFGVLLAACGVAVAAGLAAQTPPGTPDIGNPYEAPRGGDDYERREVKIPMRDGVALFTVIVVPKAPPARR